jgi:hypothetical protein
MPTIYVSDDGEDKNDGSQLRRPSIPGNGLRSCMAAETITTHFVANGVTRVKKEIANKNETLDANVLGRTPFFVVAFARWKSKFATVSS